MGLYILVCVLWSIHCLQMQKKFHPETSREKYIASFFMNAVGCPISLIVAIVNMHNGRYEKYYKSGEK